MFLTFTTRNFMVLGQLSYFLLRNFFLWMDKAWIFFSNHNIFSWIQTNNVYIRRYRKTQREKDRINDLAENLRGVVFASDSNLLNLFSLKFFFFNLVESRRIANLQIDSFSKAFKWILKHGRISALVRGSNLKHVSVPDLFYCHLITRPVQLTKKIKLVSVSSSHRFIHNRVSMKVYNECCAIFFTTTN